MTLMLPTWVRKRDGRREPFDADKISQSLYAATEAAGVPSAFLARELADGVLHFLVRDGDTHAPATTEIADLIEKVVRELGHPALAKAYVRHRQGSAFIPDSARTGVRTGMIAFTAADPPTAVVAICLRTYSLQTVFTRDLAAAHEEGLLHLGGLESPQLLDGVVVATPPPDAEASPVAIGWAQVSQARRQAGRLLVVDSPEHLFAALGPMWLQSFLTHLESSDRYAILNVNLAAPPHWAATQSGPLFSHGDAGPDLTDAIVEAFWVSLSNGPHDRLQIHWHLQAHAGRYADVLERRVWTAGLASKVTFVCDRGDRPIALAEALDRLHPAVLMEVGLPLRKFLAKPGIDGDAGKLLEKLPSLVRMAAHAGMQKRNYLRRVHAELSRGFLLDRARLVLTLCDLGDVIRAWTGADPSQSKLALDAARRILRTLHDAVARESRSANLDILIARPWHALAQFASATDASASLSTAAVFEEFAEGCWAEIPLPDTTSAGLRRTLETMIASSPLRRFRLKQR